jgi:hypothetical protein
MHLQYVDYFESDWKERLNAAIRRRQAQLSGPRSISPPKGQIVREETSTVLELVEVEFSDVTDRYECAGSYVRYNLPGIYWTLVNSKIAALALDGYFSSRRFLRELAAEDPPEKVGTISGHARPKSSLGETILFLSGPTANPSLEGPTPTTMSRQLTF